MQERNGFSLETLRRTGWRHGERLSDKFSDEDIERMFRNAARKVGPFVMPEVRRDS